MASAPIRAPIKKDGMHEARALRDDLAARMKNSILIFEQATGCIVDQVRLSRPERADFTGRKRSRLIVDLKVVLGAQEAAPADSGDAP
jgi:hypothetical protein